MEDEIATMVKQHEQNRLRQNNSASDTLERRLQDSSENFRDKIKRARDETAGDRPTSHPPLSCFLSFPRFANSASVSKNAAATTSTASPTTVCVATFDVTRPSTPLPFKLVTLQPCNLATPVQVCDLATLQLPFKLVTALRLVACVLTSRHHYNKRPPCNPIPIPCDLVACLAWWAKRSVAVVLVWWMVSLSYCRFSRASTLFTS
jgi:hypothetical protein